MKRIFLFLCLMVFINQSVFSQSILKGKDATYLYDYSNYMLRKCVKTVEGLRIQGYQTEPVLLEFHSPEGAAEIKSFYKKYKKESWIPKVYDYLQTDDGKEVIITELMYLDLHSLMHKVGRHFSETTVMMLCKQLLEILEKMHNAGLIINDFNPRHFAVSYTNRSRIVFTDIDLCSDCYLENGEHIKEDKKFKWQNPEGHLGFASMYAHQHSVISRRDNMESLGYVFYYFTKGKFPWPLVECSTSDGIEEIYKMKEQFIKSLDYKYYYPREFILHAQSLPFEQNPDHSKFIKLVDAEIDTIRDKDRVFDWINKKDVSPKVWMQYWVDDNIDQNKIRKKKWTLEIAVQKKIAEIDEERRIRKEEEAKKEKKRREEREKKLIKMQNKEKGLLSSLKERLTLHGKHEASSSKSQKMEKSSGKSHKQPKKY